MDPVTNSTPVVPAKTTPVEAILPTGDAYKALFEKLSNEDFCVEVAREVLRRQLILPEKKLATTKNGRDTVWGAWDLGTGSGLYKSVDLTPVQSGRLRTVHGIPMALGFRVTVLDIVPQPQAEARRKEREVQTATRDTNRAGSVSTSTLLDELNRRRAAEGLEPIKG